MAAKHFYQNDFIPPETNLKSGQAPNIRHMLCKELLWNYAYLRQLADSSMAVIIPLVHDKELYPVKGNTAYSLNELSNIMMYRNPQGLFELEVVTTLPDSAYFANYTGSNKFTGLVVVEKWNGELLKSIHYTNEGVFVYHRQEQPGSTTLKMKTPNELCPIFTDWYTCTSIDGGKTWDCRYQETTVEHVECSGSGGSTPQDEEHETVYNYPPNTGSGGTGGIEPDDGNSPQDIPLQEKIDSTLNLNNIPDWVKDILMEDLERMHNNCVGEFILDALSGANGLLNSSFNINVVYDTNALFDSYNPETNTLTLSEVINFFSETMLIHELTHALQDALYPSDVMYNGSHSPYFGRGQIELEAHVVEDLSRGGESYTNYKHFSYERSVKDNYKLFMQDLKNGSTDINKFNSFIGPFMEHYPEYEGIPDINFTPTIFQLAYQYCNN